MRPSQVLLDFKAFLVYFGAILCKICAFDVEKIHFVFKNNVRATQIVMNINLKITKTLRKYLLLCIFWHVSYLVYTFYINT